jgi:hypothetical protein
MRPEVDTYFRDPAEIAIKHAKEFHKLIERHSSEYRSFLNANYSKLTEVIYFII